MVDPRIAQAIDVQTKMKDRAAMRLTMIFSVKEVATDESASEVPSIPACRIMPIPGNNALTKFGTPHAVSA
jgi:hypothetical protein